MRALLIFPKILLLIAATLLTLNEAKAATLTSSQFLISFGPAQGANEGTLTLTNTGNQPITNFALNITGANPADFSILTNTCKSLAPVPGGNYCTVIVAFLPSAYGLRTATLNVASNGLPALLPVALHGLAQPPTNLELTAKEVQLGAQLVGQPISFFATANYLGNSYVVPLFAIQSIQITGPAASDYQFGPYPLSDAGCDFTCYISVTFTPSAPGLRAAQINLVTTLGSVVIPMQGYGISQPVDEALTTASLTFTPQGLATLTPPQGVGVISTGTSNLQVTSATITGPDAADFTLDDQCTGVYLGPLSDGDRPFCTEEVSFAPTAAGPRTATLNIFDNTPAGVHTVALSGTGVNTAANFLIGQPTVLSFLSSGATQAFDALLGTAELGDFGDVALGQPKTLVNHITNIGGASLSASLSITGVNASDFLLNPTASPTDCAASSALSLNSVCSSGISFNPSAVGPRTATLTVTDTASGISRSFALSGNGVTATKKLVFVESNSPSSRGFGALAVSSSTSGVLKIANAGNVPVTLTGSYFSGSNGPDFKATGYQCTSNTNIMQPGDTCTFNVTFMPLGEGYRTARFDIFSDNGTDPELSIPVTGASYPAAYQTLIAASQSPVNVPAIDLGFLRVGTSSSTYSAEGFFEFLNFSSAPVTLNQLTVSGPNAADVFAQNTCQSQLSSQSVCYVYPQLTPSVAGPEIAYLTLANDSPFGNIVVAVYGYGEAPPAGTVLAAPAALHFHNTATQLTLSLFSSSGAPLNVMSQTIQGTDANLFNAPVASCTPNTFIDFNSCTIPIQYLSIASGTASATMHIVTNQGAVDVPLLVNLPAALPQVAVTPPLDATVLPSNETEEIAVFTSVSAIPLPLQLGTPAFSGPAANLFQARQLYCYDSQLCSLPFIFTGNTGSLSIPVTVTDYLNMTSGDATLPIPIVTNIVRLPTNDQPKTKK